MSWDETSGVAIETSRSEPAGWGFEPRWLLIIMVSVPLAATLFWWVGVRYFGSRLQFLEYQQFAAVVTVGVAGGYQLYFWVQRNRFRRRAVCLKISLDDRIPFVPEWIWLYSFLYYLMMGVTVVSIQDLAEGVRIIFGGLVLLVTGCAIFYFSPPMSRINSASLKQIRCQHVTSPLCSRWTMIATRSRVCIVHWQPTSDWW